MHLAVDDGQRAAVRGHGGVERDRGRRDRRHDGARGRALPGDVPEAGERAAGQALFRERLAQHGVVGHGRWRRRRGHCGRSAGGRRRRRGRRGRGRRRARARRRAQGGRDRRGGRVAAAELDR
ncbi:MAG: hypothetical protein FJ296_02925, partial [Planctomycetes bacterium]|nr:hypothetical protein [Planctomycetota bacterium]